MNSQVQDVLQQSLTNTGIEIIAIMSVAFMFIIPFIFLKSYLDKQQQKDIAAFKKYRQRRKLKRAQKNKSKGK